MTIKVDLGTEAVVREIRDYTTFIKRSLMSFDKLNRLVKKSSGSSGGKGKLTEVKESLTTFELIDQTVKSAFEAVSGVAGKVRELVDSGKLLKGQLEGMPGTLSQTVDAALEMLWTLMGVPNVTDNLVTGVCRLGQEVKNSISALSNMPISLDQSVMEMKSDLSDFPAWMLYNYTIPVREAIEQVFGGLMPGARSAWEEIQQVFKDYSVNVYGTVTTLWKKVKDTLSNTGNVFESLSGGVSGALVGAVNRVISSVNETCITPFQSLNAAFSKLKNFKIGGLHPFQNFNFSVPVPKIPLLAKGAVLPANKPFLAVLGDQKSGTNVEAPLSTIQQAVADVMQDVVEAEMAGHNATVGILRRILEAVLGLSLNEQAIGQAAAGYALRQNMMTGGY